MECRRLYTLDMIRGGGRIHGASVSRDVVVNAVSKLILSGLTNKREQVCLTGLICLFVDLSLLLQNPKRWIPAAIVAALFLTHALCSYGQEPPNDLMRRQIEALTTGDTAEIFRIREYSLQVQLTQRWTSIAAGMFKEASANVDRDSALLLSKLIYRGAFQFVRRGAPVQSVYLAEGNLRKFIETEIEIGKKENTSRPPIGEKAFDQAKHSICPLWPFC
jgi:hypothetical protein